MLFFTCGGLANEASSFALVEAILLEVDLEGERVVARGEARLQYGDFVLYADEIRVDNVTGEVEAAGDLRIVQVDRVLTGDMLAYNLHTQEGSLTDARLIEQGVIITGERIDFSPHEISAHRSAFTTCDLPRPHFALRTGRITLTAQEIRPDEPPRSGVLTLDRSRIVYRERTLLPLPRYSVNVGQLEEREFSPVPLVGYGSRDGPYASYNYTYEESAETFTGDIIYRYTTFRGIRGHVRAYRQLGPGEVTFGYFRREDPSDRDIEPDDLEAELANVLVNRQPEYGVVLRERRLLSAVRVQASWLAGRYIEHESDGIEELARANRRSYFALISNVPYPVSDRVKLSHAIGWRRSSYSSGERLTVRHLRTTADVEVNPRMQFQLSHIIRDDSGETPFQFDGIGPAQELIGEAIWTASPAWRLRTVQYWDLERNRSRDMIVEATRTAHCLEYTVGWRSERRRFYVGIGLARPVEVGIY